MKKLKLLINATLLSVSSLTIPTGAANQTINSVVDNVLQVT
jgi:hypothetical protein